MDRQTAPTPPPLAQLLEAVRACRICVEAPEGRPLPHPPRPVLRASPTARLCISGQAPGTRVHASGVPFDDPSGDRLRSWMGLGRDAFYDTERIAIVPMGFCFPGLDAKGSDLPPRRECRPVWHDRVYAALPRLDLVLAIGAYAQRYHLGPEARGGVTATVERWRQIAKTRSGPTRTYVMPLPHPSWRNSGWLKRNPWFEAELVPELRDRVAATII